jgi:hypothetical protein
MQLVRSAQYCILYAETVNGAIDAVLTVYSAMPTLRTCLCCTDVARVQKQQ